jgi:L-ascorbate metabolism protein UlaG (beta-lactamase superfamily)
LASLTWLGHASFRLDTDDGKRIYIDPFLKDNPKTPDSEREPERVDVIALTHGHGDHAADVVDISKKFPDAEIVAMIELKRHLGNEGANVGNMPGINKGGTQTVGNVRFTLTDARHSNGGENNEYLGDAAGLVVRLADGTSIYFAGDTCVFGDMQLIGRLYQPNVAVLPIGDHFTMGPEEAAVALELLGNPRCIPCHYGTFPVLTGTPEALAALTEAPLEVLQPGDTLEL